MTTNIPKQFLGLRQEVPIERWFYDHDKNTHLKDSSAIRKARLDAIPIALESVLRTLAEAICLIYSRLFSPETSEQHSKVLAVQWQGLKYSLQAIGNPNKVKHEGYFNGFIPPKIGVAYKEGEKLEWGTLYTGKYTISWLDIGSRYPWIV